MRIAGDIATASRPKKCQQINLRVGYSRQISHASFVRDACINRLSKCTDPAAPTSAASGHVFLTTSLAANTEPHFPCRATDGHILRHCCFTQQIRLCGLLPVVHCSNNGSPWSFRVRAPAAKFLYLLRCTLGCCSTQVTGGGMLGLCRQRQNFRRCCHVASRVQDQHLSAW